MIALTEDWHFKYDDTRKTLKHVEIRFRCNTRSNVLVRHVWHDVTYMIYLFVLVLVGYRPVKCDDSRILLNAWVRLIIMRLLLSRLLILKRCFYFNSCTLVFIYHLYIYHITVKLVTLIAVTLLTWLIVRIYVEKNQIC